MTLFRKYYKEANDDIKASDDLINRVIENAHAKQPPIKYRKYQKYAVSLAAAVLIVSAAVISTPFLEKERDDGVIIEESIIQTPSPSNELASTNSENEQPPVTTETPTSNAEVAVSLPKINDSDKKTVKPTLKPNTNKHSYIDYGSSDEIQTSESQKLQKVSEETPQTPVPVENNIKENSVVLNNEEMMFGKHSILATPQGVENDEIHEKARQPELSSDYSPKIDTNESSADTGLAMFSGVLPSDLPKIDTDETLADTESAKEIDVPEDKYSSNISTGASDSISGSMGGGGAECGGSGSIAAAPTRTSIPTPNGYYVSSNSSSSTIFASDLGAKITVSYKYGDYSYSEPVYSVSGESISVYFTTNGMEYNIYAVGAEYSSVEELVNSII